MGPFKLVLCLNWFSGLVIASDRQGCALGECVTESAHQSASLLQKVSSKKKVDLTLEPVRCRVMLLTEDDEGIEEEGGGNSSEPTDTSMAQIGGGPELVGVKRNGDGYKWFDCQVVEANGDFHKGDIVHLLDEGDAEGDFIPNQVVELEIRPSDHPHPEFGVDVVYHVAKLSLLEAVSAPLSGGSSRGGSSSGPVGWDQPLKMTMIFIFMQYRNAGVDYEDKATFLDKIYTGQGSFGDIIEKSTYGRITAPKSLGKLVTVNIDEDWEQEGCPYSDWNTKARDAVRSQHPDVDLDSYTHKNIYIPTTSGCGWAGLGSVGCGHPAAYNSNWGAPDCTTWEKHPGMFVIAHELGHNLGLSHAGGVLRGEWYEYGDHQALMGNSNDVSSFNAGARHQLTTLMDIPGEAATYPDVGMNYIKLQTLSLDPGVDGADYVAVRWACPNCNGRIRGNGGYLWVQFRGDEGYSSHLLKEEWQNKVYVHYFRPYTNIQYGPGSELWTRLGAGEQYDGLPDNSPYSVIVCSIVGDVAAIAIGTTVREAAQQCGPTPTPTPAPTIPCVNVKADTSCNSWESMGYCEKGNQFEPYMAENCRKRCGYCKTETPTPTTPTAWPTASPTAQPTDAPTVAPTASPTASPSGKCEDKEKGCGEWAKAGYCVKTYVEYMTANCPSSCNMCGNGPAPTVAPTTPPTAWPTASPTAQPTDAPTVAPTTPPTAWPTASPTAQPTDAPTVAPTASPTGSPNGNCEDKFFPEESCGKWANMGYCVEKYVEFMTANCPSSCNMCGNGPTASPTAQPTVAPTVAPTSCVDLRTSCGGWAKAGYCLKNYVSYMKVNCRSSCNWC